MVLDATDWDLRHSIYSALAATGSPPSRTALVATVGDPAELDRRLHVLHDQHHVVLDADDSIRMALPFSAVPTDHVVRSDGRTWFANCAWDALAIPAALGVDAAIEAPWSNDGTPVDLRVEGGELAGDIDAYVHFAVPARHWWDDIVET